MRNEMGLKRHREGERRGDGRARTAVRARVEWWVGRIFVK